VFCQFETRGQATHDGKITDVGDRYIRRDVAKGGQLQKDGQWVKAAEPTADRQYALSGTKFVDEND
tara:strand:- start:102 stop:299 length:198 start_codon:yes stop_codon:yes gene_type:complete